MASKVETPMEENLQNQVENSEEDDLDENGIVEDPTVAKTKKKKKKKKKPKCRFV